VLEAFRAVGVIALPLKCPVLKRGVDNFVTTSVKNGFQVFDCKSLRLLFVSSPATPRGIKALEVHGDFTFAASGALVHKFKRGKEVGQIGPHSGNITHMLVIGDNLFVHSNDGHVVGYDVKSSEEILQMDLAKSGVTAKASRSAAKLTAWVHPTSYLNKLLLGDEEGSLFIVNVRSGKCVHRFAPLGASVTAIAQSPAVDVLAVGLVDGRIIVRNIKFDETLFEFMQTDGAVTGLCFRTDNTSILASGSSNGGLYIWSLEDERLVSSMPQAHDSQVCTCTFMQGEPILLTSGGDNAVKMWIFDQDDGSARLLRSRNGHSAPPTRVRYYNQHSLLSAGQDRSFRIFSTIQDQQSREMSQGHLEKKAKALSSKAEDLKLNPVIDFASASLREKDWCNVLTCHQDDNRAYTWRYKNAVLGKHVLRPPALDYAAAHLAAMGEDGPRIDPFKKVPGRLPGQVVDYEHKIRKKGALLEHEVTKAKAVCMSGCGNFGIVGYACGRIDKFNMQSGAHRGSFWAQAPAGHTSAIHGLDMSALNEELISASFDGSIKIWGFDDRTLLHTFEVGAPVNQIVLNRDNSLLAATADDLKLRLYDLSSRRLVRVFEGHTNRITDVCLSPDGRWALSASADRSVRIYDIPTSRLIDWVRFDRAVTGVAMSPSGDFVCTSHAASVGIYLWANRTHFANVFLGYAAPSEATDLRLPTSSGPQEGAAASEDPSAPGIELYPPLSEQLTPDLITFSTVPRPRWQVCVCTRGYARECWGENLCGLRIHTRLHTNTLFHTRTHSLSLSLALSVTRAYTYIRTHIHTHAAAARRHMCTLIYLPICMQ